MFGSSGWGVERELAAQTVELLQVLVLATARIRGVKGSRLPKFVPVPRPHRESDPPKLTAAEKIRAFSRTLGRG